MIICKYIQISGLNGGQNLVVNMSKQILGKFDLFFFSLSVSEKVFRDQSTLKAIMTLLLIISAPTLPKAVWRKVIAPDAGSLRKVSRGDATHKPQELIPPMSAMVSRRSCRKPHYTGLSTEIPAAGGRNTEPSGSGRSTGGLITFELSSFDWLKGVWREARSRALGVSSRWPGRRLPLRRREGSALVASEREKEYDARFYLLICFFFLGLVVCFLEYNHNFFIVLFSCPFLSFSSLCLYNFTFNSFSIRSWSKIHWLVRRSSDRVLQGCVTRSSRLHIGFF